MNILIIGCGIVGNATLHGFQKIGNDIRIIDATKSDTTLDNIHQQHPDWLPNVSIFSLPTPTIDGESNIATTVELLRSHQSVFPNSQVIIQSTMTPDKIQYLSTIDPLLVYRPEFLRKTSAVDDYVSPYMIVYGGDPERTQWVHRMYATHSAVNLVEPNYCSISDAALIKYAINSFLAMKVAWANELYDVVDNHGDTNWETFQSIIQQDSRIGDSHLNVPNNGQFGFSGGCLPKDIHALSDYMKIHNIENDLISAVISSNNKKVAK